jgi:hypothetical protein
MFRTEVCRSPSLTNSQGLDFPPVGKTHGGPKKDHLFSLFHSLPVMRNCVHIKGHFPTYYSHGSNEVSVPSPLPWFSLTKFLETYLHKWASSSTHTSMLKMEAAPSSEMLLSTYKTTQYYNPQDSNLI